jgi:chitin synthase
VGFDEGKFDPKSIPLKSWNDYENELWDQESNHSDGTWGPGKSEYMGDYKESMYGQSLHAQSMYGAPQSQSMYGAPQSMYGRGSVQQGSQLGAGYNMRSPRGLSPSGSYSDLRGGSRAGSYGGDAPPRGTFYAAPAMGDANSYSGHGHDAGSLYGAGSFYAQPMGHQASNYGLPQHHMGDTAPSEPSIEQLEQSIRRICDGADLDTLTKKGVRRQLESEYGMPLAQRKDDINRIIEAVLAE